MRERTANFELVKETNPPKNEGTESDSHIHGEASVGCRDTGAVDKVCGNA